MHDDPLVSIVVPVRNGERTIGRLIESLLATDYPKKEIIVVDGESLDGTTRIVSKYPVVLLSEKRRSSYAARNTGIANARGQIILFTDADCIVDRTWVRNIVKTYADERVSGVGGLTLPYAEPYARYAPKTVVERYVVSTSPPPPRRNNVVKLSRSQGALHSDFFPTQNASFRVEVLREVGNFDADFTSGGDVDICHRILDRGGTLFFDPDAIIYHIPRDNILALIRQFLKYGIGKAHLLSKDPRMRTDMTADNVPRGLLGMGIVSNMLAFIFRLMTLPLHRDAALFHILYPVIDSIRILTTYVGIIVGSFRYKVLPF